MSEQVFTLPVHFDYGATFFWAVSGALVGARRGYDYAGVVALALVSATGGGLIRDGFFLQNGPPALVRTPFYLLIVIGAALVVGWAGHYIQKTKHFSFTVEIVDALGLGAYAVVGMQLAASAGLSTPAIVLIGVINAVGGGVLRDVVIGREPELFKPGTLTGVAALSGCIVYVSLTQGLGLGPSVAAWPTIITSFAIRLLSVYFDLRTRALPGFAPEDPAPLTRKE